MAEDCVGSTYSVLSTMPSDSESSSSLSSVGTGTSGKAASPPPTLMDTRQMSEKLEAIVYQLRQVTRERDELRKQLALSSPGSTFDDCRPSPKPSHDYERLKMQCMKAMSDLQSLQNQQTKTLKKCEEAVKEADFYHTLHNRLRMDQSQLKEDMEVIKRENSQLLREHNHAQQTCEELKRLHEEDLKEITDLRCQQQQVMRENGSSEILNKLYDTAMDKLEGLKKDYDALRKRYNEKVANHNTDLSRLERIDEDNRRFQKQNEMLMKQTDAAVVEKTSVQQQYLSTLKRYDSIQHELSKATVQNKELQREMERLQTEVTRYKTLQLKAMKDAEKYKEERDTVLNEYRLVMSERDQVHKEIDKLQTELELAQGHLKNTSSERKVAGEELEALRQELHSALVERDHAICERNELLEKYCHEVKDKAEAQKELDQACKDIETVKEERDVARKERTEAIIQRDQLLREYYQARQCLNLQKQDSATLDMERAGKEIEMLRKQCEAMSQELKEGIQEAEVAKRRRDWAFQERDKIVAERESIRTLCDNLRRERDRAVSDLAEALRDLDDMMKQKNDAVRELKELKEKMETQLEKEARIRQLMAHNSHDSAIDTDSLEWETEVVEFPKDRDDMDLNALGFDVAGGADEPYLPGDSGIFVIKVDKGSIADGRLRVNDCLLRINDVDLTNKDRKHVIKAVLNGGGVINVLVRRRKSLGGRAITPVHISLVGHKDIGISLETGVYVATVSPGSSAAREGSLTVGDRLITINGIALENKSLTECEALLRNCRDSVSLSLMKVVPQSSSWSGQNILETLKESEKSGNCRVQESDVQVPNARNLKHNSSTQTDIFITDSNILDDKSDRADHKDGCYYDRKQLSSRSLQPNTYRTAEHSCCNYPDLKVNPLSSEIFPDRGYGIAEHEKRCFTFDSTVADCGVGETEVEKGHSPKHNGGTWPKTMVDVSPEPGKLSIFKMPKQRKPVFDPDTFKRPQTPPKMDYLSPMQKQTHSSQSSKSESGSTPPTPPKRSDSFKFKHKQQTSSASDSATTSGSPPTSPAAPQSPAALGVKQDTTHEVHDRNVGHYHPTTYLEGSALLLRTSSEEEGHQRVEEVQPVSRRRPKSAPALRPSKLAPLTVSGLSPQESIDPHLLYESRTSSSPVPRYNSSEERLSAEPQEWHRYAPKRAHRQSAGYTSSTYNSGSGSAQRSFVPCPAVTAVLRNPNVPFFTVRSRMVHSTNYPSMASQMCYPHPQHRTRNHSPTESFPSSPRTRHRPQSAICFPESMHTFEGFSPQHHAHHSLDLTGPDHNHSSDLSKSSRSTTPHGTQSLPASARIAGSSSSLAFAPSKSGRIRIPSNTRYPRLTTGSDRGSERSSPSLITPPQSPMNLETSSFGSSQSQSSISSLTKISISPVSTGDYRKDRPYLHEPRHVTVQKGAEPLGISIVCGENGGIFVSKVIGGSIAHQAGLEYGDQLLEYNGINLRNATEQQARLIIGQTEPCETITILAQYNPHMYQLGNHSRSSSRLDPISNHSTPHGSGATTPDNHSIIDAVSEQDEGTITPPSKQTTPTTSPRNSIRRSIDSTNQTFEPRFLFLKKTQMDLGIQICGGNLYGVFVVKVEDDSPAKGPDGLVTGDKLLEYNGVDMRNVTAEQAYVEMLKPTESISVKAQYKIEEFNRIRDEAGDGFYIRALYDRVAEVEQDLSFKKDDILYVDDTLPQGNFGYWMTWQLDENAQKLERGHIPSKYMMDQEFCRRHSMSEVRDENVKTLSAAARRSFFRRKQKHKRNNSKDGKEMLALDAISTDSIPLLEDSGSLAYQRVQKVECTSPRPVLILGPLVDAVKDMLVKDSPGKFCRCPLEVMKASQQAIERGVADYLFIDYKRRSGHFDVTTVASIKEITEKDCHCLLDIAPHAIERLHRIHIYPIVIFIRYKNLKQIKEQKDPIFLRDKGTQKRHSKEQFEAAQKIEQEYSKFFTGIVQGGTLPYICTQIMTIVDQEQNKVLWIPAGTL
ncbi:disks large homolog 5a isoform X3 [Leucoraja erinacea]|uniref:disks large homolog 5a isoform X3 n=1 Tax=Leucoraja erinaceus TaxID=7782 RepID=UPI00245590EE|nr:disks large homolog 5a isoform X3 [Leucoraja erinacea]